MPISCIDLSSSTGFNSLHFPVGYIEDQLLMMDHIQIRMYMCNYKFTNKFEQDFHKCNVCISLGTETNVPFFVTNHFAHIVNNRDMYLFILFIFRFISIINIISIVINGAARY